MGTRYVYWRKPTGAAYKGKDQKHAPQRLLADLGTSASVSAEGKISWSGMSAMRLEQVVLASSIVVDPDEQELNQHDAQSLVRKSLLTLIRKKRGGQPIDSKALLAEADRQAAAYFRKRMDRYVLVTSLTVKSFPAGQITVDDCLIKPLDSRKRYPIPDNLRRELEAEPQRALILRNKQQLIRVQATARSIYDAADRALRATTVLCGLWNLFATHGSWTIRFGRKREPVGVVHLGQFHTLHTQDGKPAVDLYWYESDYMEHRKLFSPKKDWSEIEKCRRWALRKMRHLPYRDTLRRLVVRYATALSKSDPDVAFLQMWSILESITNTVGAKYEETIRRATWIFHDAEIVREFLTYLRCYRNQYVHAARSNDDRGQVAQLVKSFIEPHLLRLIHNDFHVQSIEEYASFLSLPTSIDALERHQKWSARAIRIRQSRSKAK